MIPSNISISFGDVNFYVMSANDSCYKWIPCGTGTLEDTERHMVNPKDYDNMDDLMKDIFKDTEERW